jgi:hypothetical protein
MSKSELLAAGYNVSFDINNEGIYRSTTFYINCIP